MAAGSNPLDASSTPEVCNGLDDDRDGTVDDGVTSNFYADGDGDSYGAGTTMKACSRATGTRRDAG